MGFFNRFKSKKNGSVEDLQKMMEKMNAWAFPGGDAQLKREANELYELLASTQIEDFDAVEEAFKLLDTEGNGELTVETFKTIFKNLELGEIAPSDEDIFREVADFDGDGKINLSDFR